MLQAGGKGPCRAHQDRHRFGRRITIDPHRERRHRQTIQAILVGQRDGTAQRPGQVARRIRILVIARPTRVNDQATRQVKARRDHRLAQLQRRKQPAYRLEPQSGGRINSTAHTTAGDELRVGRIDDAIAIGLADKVAFAGGDGG